MPESNHSAEWLRGKIDGLEDMAIAFETPSLQLLAVECRNRASECRTLLAAAEAREAGTPTAEDVIAACKRAILAEDCNLFTRKLLERGAKNLIAAWEAARR